MKWQSFLIVKISYVDDIDSDTGFEDELSEVCMFMY